MKFICKTSQVMNLGFLVTPKTPQNVDGILKNDIPSTKQAVFVDGIDYRAG